MPKAQVGTPVAKNEKIMNAKLLKLPYYGNCNKSGNWKHTHLKLRTLTKTVSVSEVFRSSSEGENRGDIEEENHRNLIHPFINIANHAVFTQNSKLCDAFII